MKELKAVIRPGKLAALREALHLIDGFPGMTVMKAEGCSGSTRSGPAATIRDELTDYTAKVHIVMICPDEVVEALFDCIVKVSSTGHVGDGIVWITDVPRASFICKG